MILTPPGLVELFNWLTRKKVRCAVARSTFRGAPCPISAHHLFNWLTREKVRCADTCSTGFPSGMIFAPPPGGVYPRSRRRRAGLRVVVGLIAAGPQLTSSEGAAKYAIRGVFRTRLHANSGV